MSFIFGEFNDPQKITSKSNNSIALITVLDFHIFFGLIFSQGTQKADELNRNALETQQRVPLQVCDTGIIFRDHDSHRVGPLGLRESGTAINCR